MYSFFEYIDYFEFLKQDLKLLLEKQGRNVPWYITTGMLFLFCCIL